MRDFCKAAFNIGIIGVMLFIVYAYLMAMQGHLVDGTTFK